MIFDELVSEVCERLNLTSDEARSRVGRHLNNRYRRVTSGIGLESSRRTEVDATATIGETTLTFEGIEKILAVIDRSSGKDIVLEEVTPYEIVERPLRGEPPRLFAVTNMHPDSIDIQVDCEATTAYTLYAKGITSNSTMSGSDIPDFPESFHDLLVFGAMADEYRKMEKVELARDAEADFERRVSDLRMFIAKSAYMDLTQGRYADKKFGWGFDPRYSWNR